MPEYRRGIMQADGRISFGAAGQSEFVEHDHSGYNLDQEVMDLMHVPAAEFQEFNVLVEYELGHAVRLDVHEEEEDLPPAPATPPIDPVPFTPKPGGAGATQNPPPPKDEE